MQFPALNQTTNTTRQNDWLMAKAEIGGGLTRTKMEFHHNKLKNAAV